MNHFKLTLAVLGLLLVVLAAGGLAMLGWRQQERARRFALEERREAAVGRLAAEKSRVARQRTAHPPIVRFLNAWQPHVVRLGPGRSPGAGMRTILEELAQRKLGLITDQVTTPEPVSLLVAGRPVLVQRVNLRASGENLNALLTWLGEAEALYPYARVEFCEIAAGTGKGVSVRLALAQPLPKANEEKATR